MMPPPDKNTSVFLDGALPHVGDLSHAETRRCGEFFSRKDHKAGGPTSVSATIDRSGWKQVRLGDVCKPCRGVRVVRSQLSQGRYLVYQNSLIPLGHYDKCNTPANTTFVIAAGSAGEIGYCDEPFWAADDCFFLLPNQDVISKFLYYSLAAQQQHISGLVRRGSVPRLARDIVGNLVLTLPDMAEQEKIVRSLTAIDINISTIQSLVAKYEAIKKATVNLLLKPKAGWNKIRLADFESHRNNTCSRSLTSSSKGNVHNIHYGDILVNFGEIVSMKYDHVDCLSEEGEACSPKDYLQDGDIVIADTAEDETAGKVIEVQDVEGQKAVAGLHTVFLRPPSNLFARGWLGYWMNSRFYHDQLLPYMTGIKVLSLSKSSIANTEICYPAMEKQKHIVGILKSIDTHIATLQAQACIARQLKDGMMSYFFG